MISSTRFSSKDVTHYVYDGIQRIINLSIIATKDIINYIYGSMQRHCIYGGIIGQICLCGVQAC